MGLVLIFDCTHDRLARCAIPHLREEALRAAVGHILARSTPGLV
jgi:hypothetical protein